MVLLGVAVWVETALMVARWWIAVVWVWGAAQVSVGAVLGGKPTSCEAVAVRWWIAVVCVSAAMRVVVGAAAGE